MKEKIRELEYETTLIREQMQQHIGKETNGTTNIDDSDSDKSCAMGYSNGIDITKWREWNRADVYKWVSKVLGFERYAYSFVDQWVCGEDLADLNDEVLRKELRIRPAAHRRQILHEIEQLGGNITTR